MVKRRCDANALLSAGAFKELLQAGGGRAPTSCGGNGTMFGASSNIIAAGI